MNLERSKEDRETGKNIEKKLSLSHEFNKTVELF